MPLKNYTSAVPANRSINHIENALVRNGARGIMKQYDEDGRVSAIIFTIALDGQNIVPIKLPAKVEACEQILMGMTTSRTRPETLEKIPAQAERTAWKICLDWVEAQMAMVELAQVELMELFLPYLYNEREDMTYFETVKAAGFKGLLGPGSGR